MARPTRLQKVYVVSAQSDDVSRDLCECVIYITHLRSVFPPEEDQMPEGRWLCGAAAQGRAQFSLGDITQSGMNIQAFDSTPWGHRRGRAGWRTRGGVHLG